MRWAFLAAMMLSSIIAAGCATLPLDRTVREYPLSSTAISSQADVRLAYFDAAARVLANQRWTIVTSDRPAVVNTDHRSISGDGHGPIRVHFQLTTTAHAARLELLIDFPSVAAQRAADSKGVRKKVAEEINGSFRRVSDGIETEARRLIRERENTRPQDTTTSLDMPQPGQPSPAEVPRYCGSCGRQFGPTDRFCSQCGDPRPYGISTPVH